MEKGLSDFIVNIFSHLLGAALFFSLPVIVYNTIRDRYDSASTGDILVFSTFFFGVAICFLLSALCVPNSHYNILTLAHAHTTDFISSQITAPLSRNLETNWIT